MPVTVTCECGHVTELADREQPADATVVPEQDCSACGRALTVPAPSGKRMFQQLWQSHVGDANAPATPIEATVAPPVEESLAAEPSKPRRSLWEVMRGSASTPHESSAPSTETSEATDALASDVSASDAIKPKGLWGVMPGVSNEVDSASSEQRSEESGRGPDEGLRGQRVPQVIPLPKDAGKGASIELPVLVTLTPAQKYAQAASLASMTHVAVSWQPEPAEDPFDAEEREWSRRAVTALACAVLTVLVAAASLRPEWWWRGLALGLGLVAVLLGFVASAEVRRSRGRLKGSWVARSSVFLGAAGMFLAPLVFAQLGERQRENAAREDIVWRLRRLGEGLDQFHAQQGHFPEAAIKGRDAHGDTVPMHGWMTPLLPSLGQDALYRRIDLKQPFDAPENVPAMQQQIPEFSLPRRRPARSQRGFALAHFAGIGGQDVREPTGLVHFGMFTDGSSVKREQITDGLSQTLIVGEIRDRDPPAPPWGEPGNVRSIGDGLNRQFRGFGNEKGTGATFLHADGSVKFYSNKTDRRVLERLETRDGGERE